MIVTEEKLNTFVRQGKITQAQKEEILTALEMTSEELICTAIKNNEKDSFDVVYKDTLNG